MASLSQLEKFVNDVTTAAKVLAEHCQDTAGAVLTPHLAVPSDAPREVQQARRDILNITARIQIMLAEPADLINHLANNNQLLACLQWLGEFQVLACVPLSGSVPAKDVAELAGVPESQLCRVVRMTSMVGFLYEPEPGRIAHTTLSAPFVTKLSYLDAAMFLAEVGAPMALQMAAATKRPNVSAYGHAFNTTQTFQTACKQRVRLQRQWSAYLRLEEDASDSIIGLLSRLDWRSLDKACIVDACADSEETATALAELFPSLRFVVQITEPISVANGTSETEGLNSRITVEERVPGTMQKIEDAAVYIVRLPKPLPGATAHSLSPRILAELRAHLGVLRAGSCVTLILTLYLLPEPGSVDPDIEATACLRDLSRLQLGMSNERELEIGELVEMVNSVHDSMGCLVVVNKLRVRNTPTIALGVKYHAHEDSLHETEPVASNVLKDMYNMVPLNSEELEFSWINGEGYE